MDPLGKSACSSVDGLKAVARRALVPLHAYLGPKSHEIMAQSLEPRAQRLLV